MYPEYKKVKKILSQAEELLSSSMKMEDIYHSIISRNKKRVAVQYIDDNEKLKKYKYFDFNVHVNLYASAIAEILNSKPKNTVVVLKLANSRYWGEIFWAILMNGFKPLLLDAKTSKENTANIISQSKAVAIISEDAYQYEVKKISIEDILQNQHKLIFTPNWENEVIFSSSGTTGDAKLMIFNGENIIHQICCSLDMAEETKDIMYPEKMGKCKILAMVPFHHVFGFVAVFLWYTFYGKTIVYPNSIAPSDLQSLCQKVGVTHVYSVPLFWDSLAQSLSRKFELEDEGKRNLVNKMISYNIGAISKEEAGIAAKSKVMSVVQSKILGNSIRFCISGGGYISKETLTYINGIGYPLYNGFGMTEIGVICCQLSPNVKNRLNGSIGKPFHGVEFKLSENGELLIKSKATHIREIIGGVEQNADIDKDGYFHSGDIAAFENGEYYIKGRIKDVIINADGENIFPDELEIYFKNLPKVTHLCILGVKSGKGTNEDVDLVLELDNSVTEEEVKEIEEQIKEINQHLPHNVKIAHTFLARRKLPLANNMKIKRFVIKQGLESNSDEYIPLGENKKKKEAVVFSKEVEENILLPMRDIFAKILILPKFKIEDDGHWINDLGGDSMSYIELVRAVENYFHVSIPEEQYGKLENINDFVSYVDSLLKENNESVKK